MMNLQTEARPRKFQRSAAAARVFPSPALDAPTSPSNGDADNFNAYWRGREAVVTFLDFPDAFVAGIVDELRRRDVPLLTAITAVENQIFRAIRASRRTRHQVEVKAEVLAS